VHNAVAHLTQRYQLLVVEADHVVVEFDQVSRFGARCRQGGLKLRESQFGLLGELTSEP